MFVQCYILILVYIFSGVSLNYNLKNYFSVKKSLILGLYNINFVVPFIDCVDTNNKVFNSDYDKYVEAVISYNQGIKCTEENNIQCAKEKYLYSLSLMPIFPQANQNLGILFEDDYSSINRFEMSIKHHTLSVEQSEDSKFKSEALTNLANVYMRMYGDFSSIKETDSRFQTVFKILIDALIEWPNNIQSMVTLGVLHSQIGNFEQARNLFLKVLGINQKNLHAILNLGNYYFHNNIFDKSSFYYKQVVELARDDNNSFDMIRGYNNLGQCFREMGMQTEALNSFRSALKEFNFYNDINQDDFIQLLLWSANNAYAMQGLSCDWKNMEILEKYLEMRLHKDKNYTGNREQAKSLDPYTFSLIRYSSAQSDLLTCVTVCNTKPSFVYNNPLDIRFSNSPIKIGYLSYDWRNHPMGRLTQWLVTHHNDSIIRSSSLSYGPNDKSYIRHYIENKSNFIDFYLEMNDAEVANSIKKLDLDIIIDLTAHTYKGRISIAALKPSSIVVNYLGFPGTTGCKGVDYSMVTSYIVPPELSKSLFSEKMLYLPNNYQANYMPLEIPICEKKQMCRINLINSAIKRDNNNNNNNNNNNSNSFDKTLILCSFNANKKMEPISYLVWMNILRRIPNSFLFLLDTSDIDAENRLLEQAAYNGILRSRIKFLPKKSWKDHLLRSSSCDLVLDTFTYGAHTTSSDMLWMWVPVISLQSWGSNRMPSRVASSITSSLDSYIDSYHCSRISNISDSINCENSFINTMISFTTKDYENTVIKLAKNLNNIQVLHNSIGKKTLLQPTFDKLQMELNIERTYQSTWESYQIIKNNNVMNDLPHIFVQSNHLSYLNFDYDSLKFCYYGLHNKLFETFNDLKEIIAVEKKDEKLLFKRVKCLLTNILYFSYDNLSIPLLYEYEEVCDVFALSVFHRLYASFSHCITSNIDTRMNLLPLLTDLIKEFIPDDELIKLEFDDFINNYITIQKNISTFEHNNDQFELNSLVSIQCNKFSVNYFIDIFTNHLINLENNLEDDSVLKIMVSELIYCIETVELDIDKKELKLNHFVVELLNNIILFQTSIGNNCRLETFAFAYFSKVIYNNPIKDMTILVYSYISIYENLHYVGLRTIHGIKLEDIIKDAVFLTGRLFEKVPQFSSNMSTIDDLYGGFIPTDLILNRNLDQLTNLTRQRGLYIDHESALYFVEILSNSAQILNNHAVCSKKENYNKVYLILSAYLSQPIPTRLLGLGLILNQYDLWDASLMFTNEAILKENIIGFKEYVKNHLLIDNLDLIDMQNNKNNNSLTIVFYCHEYGKAWWPNWGPSSLTNNGKGLGGSEEAVIYISRQLAILGYNIEIYADPLSIDMGYELISENSLGSIQWFHYLQFDISRKIDVFISWRYSISLPLGINANKVLLWLHDLVPSKLIHYSIKNTKVHKIFVQSNFHLSHILYSETDSIYFQILPNGVGQFHQVDGPNYSNLFVYGSSPDRGLIYVLMEWPTIRKHIPNAILEIYYGFTESVKLQLERSMGEVKYHLWYKEMMILLHQDGIKYFGSVNHTVLMDAYSRSGFILYPTSFSETGCITIMKAMSCGSIPITSRLLSSVLPELTNGFDYGPSDGLNIDNINKYGHKYDDSDIYEWIKTYWTSSVINAYRIDINIKKSNNKPGLYDKRQEMKKYAKTSFNWKNSANILSSNFY